MPGMSSVCGRKTREDEDSIRRNVLGSCREEGQKEHKKMGNPLKAKADLAQLIWPN
jgi:hypothetical protein